MENVGSVVRCRCVQAPEIEGLRPGNPARMLSADTHGWVDERAERRFFEWAASAGADAADPMIEKLGDCLDESFARRRVELVDDATWERTPMAEVMRETNDVEDIVSAVTRLDSTGWAFGVGLQRPVGDRPFTEHERVLLELLIRQVGRSLRRTLVPSGTRSRLSPRLRETLEQILGGYGDKQIAARMNLSQHTVHEYVKELYRRFDVSGRQELVLRCLASKEQPEPRVGRSDELES